MQLTDDVTVLKGVGPRKAAKLREAGIAQVGDLLARTPRKYEDRRTELPIGELTPGVSAYVSGMVRSRRFLGRSKNSPLAVTIEDGTGSLEILFFHGGFLMNLLAPGQRFTFFGTVTENRGKLQMVHPEFHREGDPEDIRGILPVYPAIEGFTQRELRKLTRQILSDPGLVFEEWLPEDLTKEYRLADPAFTYRNIHFPENEKYVRMARYRMIFEELLTLEAGLMAAKGLTGSAEGEGISVDPGPASEFIASLPFALTPGQEKTWREIAGDLASDRQMNRLIQGDVGSGKTAVAEIAMFAAVRSGFQAVMMAPTEILAKQHFESLTRDFTSFGIRVGLLTGDLKAADRQETLAGIADGSVDIVIGTHAVIGEHVSFRSLGLVVTDEQHRFGVDQRALLSSKGNHPNTMVMTATPIPRTLAVVLFGDMDVSTIDTLPRGRKPIRTKAVRSAGRKKVYDFVEARLREGRQAYVVTPLIEDSDAIDAKSAEEVYGELEKRFRGFRVALLHGAQKKEEKDAVMEAFAAGQVDLLVSTVVIEVGIDVPNAAVMVIENCERFGLAQMHQLRGRVGRGKEQSYCFLILQNETEIAKERARIMTETSDGFKIAEEDLKLRGPGELFGTRQHGLPEVAVADLVRHGEILEKAKNAASAILTEDPALTKEKNEGLRERILKLFGGEVRLEM